ncbi:MAG: hypothetical protein M2R45_04946 [Verrucomicrobia subdivision 3 bacterium]|nr:hypothetical protein [Limisphaerales bacterium]MCS1415617.1 hypothetical protein [Limisphaerales bacterium]
MIADMRARAIKNILTIIIQETKKASKNNSIQKQPKIQRRRWH